MAQLGNRVQHALRAYTPKDQKAVKVAAETFRPNPNFGTAEVISNLGTGEALVSVLDEKGAPTVVEQVKIVPPQSHIGSIEDDLRNQIINISEFKSKYWDAVDSESAYELLMNKIASNPNIESEVPESDKQIIEEVKTQNQEAPQQQGSILGDILGTVIASQTKQTKRKRTKKSDPQKMVEKAASQALNTAAREATKGIMRGIFGQMK